MHLLILLIIMIFIEWKTNSLYKPVRSSCIWQGLSKNIQTVNINEDKIKDNDALLRFKVRPLGSHTLQYPFQFSEQSANFSCRIAIRCLVGFSFILFTVWNFFQRRFFALERTRTRRELKPGSIRGSCGVRWKETCRWSDEELANALQCKVSLKRRFNADWVIQRESVRKYSVRSFLIDYQIH